ncbi:unnamed protein product, partial [Brassica rapa]
IFNSWCPRGTIQSNTKKISMRTNDLTNREETTPATEDATMMEMMKSIMDLLSQQEETNKATNGCLAVITVVITPPAGDVSGPVVIKSQLFQTENSTVGGRKHITNL